MSPVEEFIQSQDEKTRARIVRMIGRLHENDLAYLLQTPHFGNMVGHKNLFEIRILYLGTFYRVLSSIFNREVWLLSAFKKKTNHTPQREINKALNRKVE